VKDQDYMLLAYKEVERSNCVRTKIGALIVKDGIFIGFGHNGTNYPHECFKNKSGLSFAEGDVYCVGTHAEQDALMQAHSNTHSVLGSILYTTMRPCLACTKMIIKSGVREVIWREDYSDLPTIKAQEESNISFRRMP